MSELIYSIERSKQVIAFDGIKNGKIHPTDIDAVLEFDNRVLLLFELKLNGYKVPLGQKLALERIIDRWKGNDKNRVGYVIYANHETEPNDIIYLKDCKVFGLYSDKYAEFGKKVGMVRFLNYIAEKHDIHKLKI